RDFLMIRRPPRSTRKESSAASDVYKRQDTKFKKVKLSIFDITNVAVVPIKNNACSINSIGNFCNTCLLYTSPSPRDTERSRMPSSA
ncbi:hypothetical protein, partial [Staphylococcus aureus]